MSTTPVTLPPGFSRFDTIFAPSGSVTVEKTMGMSLVAETTACVDAVEIGTITFGLSPTNLRAICTAVAVLPCAFS